MSISRRQFAGGALASAALAQTGRRPKNVLLIMSDQHKPHAMGIDGDPVARTPNLDALCRSGVRFDPVRRRRPAPVRPGEGQSTLGDIDPAWDAPAG